MRFDFVMSHSVIVEVGGGCEAFTTSGTFVRLLSSMDSSVSVQTGAGGELLVAEITRVRSLSCVDSDVSLQQTWSVKLLSTGAAG